MRSVWLTAMTGIPPRRRPRDRQSRSEPKCHRDQRYPWQLTRALQSKKPPAGFAGGVRIHNARYRLQVFFRLNRKALAASAASADRRDLRTTGLTRMSGSAAFAHSIGTRRMALCTPEPFWSRKRCDSRRGPKTRPLTTTDKVSRAGRLVPRHRDDRLIAIPSLLQGAARWPPRKPSHKMKMPCQNVFLAAALSRSCRVVVSVNNTASAVRVHTRPDSLEFACRRQEADLVCEHRLVNAA